MSESYLEIQLDQQPIELYKLLKIADLVAGGGEAKVVISEGYVLLNGEVEYQKRKKVYHNDIVEFNGEVLQLIINEHFEDALSDQLTNEKIQQTPTFQSNSDDSFVEKQDNQVVSDSGNKPKKAKRRPISF
jgi:ribosome-associated protein